MTMRIISKREVVSIIEARESLVKLEAKARAQARVVEALEAPVIRALEAEYQLGRGCPNAVLDRTYKKNVSWKGVVEKRCGADVVAEVLEQTVATEYVRLVIEGESG